MLSLLKIDLESLNNPKVWAIGVVAIVVFAIIKLLIDLFITKDKKDTPTHSLRGKFRTKGRTYHTYHH